VCANERVHFSGGTLRPSLNGSESENKEGKKAGERKRKSEREREREREKGRDVTVAAGEAF